MRVDLAIIVAAVVVAGLVAVLEQPQKRSEFREGWVAAQVHGSDDAEMLGVVATERGGLAVGHRTDGERSTAALWETTDGHVWSQFDDAAFDLDDGSSTRLSAIGAGAEGHLLIAGVNDGTVVMWLSEDGGTHWSEVGDADVLGRGEVRAITHDGTVWLAAGHERREGGARGVVWRSLDGHAWERIEAPTLADEEHEAVLVLASGGEGTLAGGVSIDERSGATVGRTPLWTSADGRTWSQLPDEEHLAPAVTRITALAARRDQLVAALQRGQDGDGESLLGWSTDDGVTWELGQTVAARDGHIDHIMEAPDGFLLALGSVGSGPAIWVAEDPAEWELVSSPSLQESAGARARTAAVTGGNVAVIGSAGVDGRSQAVAWVHGPPKEPPAEE